MATETRRVDYFVTAVNDEPGEAYNLLSALAGQRVNMLAFVGVPVGPNRTQLTVFPEDRRLLQDVAQKAGLHLDGPHPALLASGDDEIGVLAEIHKKLAQAQVNVYASTAVTTGEGHYGYLIYVRPDNLDAAIAALGI